MKVLSPIPTNCEKQTGLQKYRQIFAKYCNDGIIDLDKRQKDKPNFQIYRLEDVVRSLDGKIPPIRHSSYWITLVKKGTGEKRIADHLFEIADHTLFIVPARTVHSSKYWSKECSGYILSFDVPFLLNSAFSMQCILNRKALNCQGEPFLRLHKRQETPLTCLFEDMLKVDNGELYGGPQMLAIKILELLIYCDQFYKNAGNIIDMATQHPVIEKFKDILRNTYHLERGVQYYADALNVHPNYLNFLSKKYTGISAKEFIDRQVVTESKYLLVNHSLRIKEIANRLGFDDPNNFSTYFQKHAGSSPLSYRSSVA